MAGKHIAQVNIARIRHSGIDADEMFPFVTKLAPINTLAERSPGFVWRLTDGEGEGATGVEVLADDPKVIINLSVWESLEAVRYFAYQTVHAKVMARRAEWFTPVTGIANLAIWWIDAGHQPDVREAVAKLRLLHVDGPSAAAFTFDTPYDAAGAPLALDPINKLCA